MVRIRKPRDLLRRQGNWGAGGQLYVTPGSSSGSSLELEAHIDEREEGEGGSGCDIDQSDLDSFEEFRVVDESAFWKGRGLGSGLRTLPLGRDRWGKYSTGGRLHPLIPEGFCPL